MDKNKISYLIVVAKTQESNLDVLIVEGSTENTKMELKQSVKLTTGFISLGTWTSRQFL
jgi:hypothetical protein